MKVITIMTSNDNNPDIELVEVAVANTNIEPADLQQAVHARRLLEALLFSSHEPLTINQMAQFFPADAQLEVLLGELVQVYENRGIELVQRGNGWAFRTAPDLGEHLEIRRVEIKPLSKAATETLAIIGYHQPVTKGEIEQIRGVSISKTTMEILLQENLIKPGKRRDTPGRPLTWVTTQHFLDYFGLANLKDLPNLKELKESGLLSKEPPASLMPQIGEDGAPLEMPQIVADNIIEGDEPFDDETLLADLDIGELTTNDDTTNNITEEQAL
jgi:segregation and condensation protein B